MTLPEPSKRRRRTPAISPKARRVFLDALAAAHSVTASADLAGVHRRRLYELRDSDPEFAAAWDDAWEAGADVVSDEIRRRGIEGWMEPMVSAGKVVTHVRKFSDRLLELEAKRRRIEYREHGPQAVAISITASQKVQPGVPLADVARELLAAGVDLHALSAGGELEAGELVAETDEPLADPSAGESEPA